MPSTGTPSSFPTVSYAHWRAVVEADQASGVGSRLRAIDEGGLRIEPLYAPGGPGDSASRNLAGRLAGLGLADGGRWRIRQRCAPERATAAVQEARGGIRSIELDARGHEASASMLDRTARELAPQVSELSYEGLDPKRAAALLPNQAMPTSFGIDPVSLALRHQEPDRFRSLLQDLARLPRPSANSRLFRASGDHFQDAGATLASTLGATMASAVACLRALEAEGTSVTDAATLAELRLPCGPHFFESIAMLRAARLVWARLLELAEAELVPVTIVALTGGRHQGLDPAVHALGNTAVAFAAAVGGADVVQLLPSDATNPSDARLAWTTGVIAEAEGALRQGLDPAEGSWFLESLTVDMAAAAWGELGRIEANGGIASELGGGKA